MIFLNFPAKLQCKIELILCQNFRVFCLLSVQAHIFCIYGLLMPDLIVNFDLFRQWIFSHFQNFHNYDPLIDAQVRAKMYSFNGFAPLNSLFYM